MRIKLLTIISFLAIPACMSTTQLSQMDSAIKVYDNQEPPLLPCAISPEVPCDPKPVHSSHPVVVNPPEQYYRYIKTEFYNSYQRDLKKGDKFIYQIKTKKYPDTQKIVESSFEILDRVGNDIKYSFNFDNKKLTDTISYNDLAYNQFEFFTIINSILPDKRTKSSADIIPSDLNYKLHFCKDNAICTEKISFKGKAYESIPVIRTDKEIFKSDWTFSQNPLSYVFQYSYAKGIGIVKGKIKYRIPETDNFNEAEILLKSFTEDN